MSSLGAGKGLLEVGKFAVYVSVPIVLMYAFANNSQNLHKFMGGVYLEVMTLWLMRNHRKDTRCQVSLEERSYVVYPPEAPRPQSPEELREMARELARKRDSQRNGGL